MASRDDIEDSVLPPSVLNAEDKDAEKERFQVRRRKSIVCIPAFRSMTRTTTPPHTHSHTQELLRKNLTLVDLAKVQKATTGTGRGRRRARSGGNDGNEDDNEDQAQTKIKAGANGACVIVWRLPTVVAVCACLRRG